MIQLLLLLPNKVYLGARYVSDPISLKQKRMETEQLQEYKEVMVTHFFISFHSAERMHGVCLRNLPPDQRLATPCCSALPSQVDGEREIKFSVWGDEVIVQIK